MISPDRIHAAVQPSDTLIVMLPGALMTPQHFIDAGFDTALTRSPHAADLQLAALDVYHLDIAASVAALHLDVIQPARQRGYRRIVLGGISLGGGVALHYARTYPGAADGLCLLAPYPGSRLTTNAIRAGGGLGCWQPSAEQVRDPEFQLWHWLASGATLPIYLGYGREDRFADDLGVMAAALPAAQVHAVDGGHDWPAWCALWNNFLATGLPGLWQD
ncbi:MAG: alpha/beta hydrolase-fold protein [Georgfuchsia sp.]